MSSTVSIALTRPLPLDSSTRPAFRPTSSRPRRLTSTAHWHARASSCGHADDGSPHAASQRRFGRRKTMTRRARGAPYWRVSTTIGKVPHDTATGRRAAHQFRLWTPRQGHLASTASRSGNRSADTRMGQSSIAHNLPHGFALDSATRSSPHEPRPPRRARLAFPSPSRPVGSTACDDPQRRRRTRPAATTRE